MCEEEGSCTCTRSSSCFSAPCNSTEWKASSGPQQSASCFFRLIHNISTLKDNRRSVRKL